MFMYHWILLEFANLKHEVRRFFLRATIVMPAFMKIFLLHFQLKKLIFPSPSQKIKQLKYTKI